MKAYDPFRHKPLNAEGQAKTARVEEMFEQFLDALEDATGFRRGFIIGSAEGQEAVNLLWLSCLAVRRFIELQEQWQK